MRYEDQGGFKHRILKWVMAFKVKFLKRLVRRGAHTAALSMLQKHILARTDGCLQNGSPDHNDWIVDCELQTRTYWAIHEIVILMNIIE